MRAVEFTGVGKRFMLTHQHERSLRASIIDTLRRVRNDEDFWAVSDLSFSVETGDVLAIVGPNGSGKSTVLRLIARILEPTVGQIIRRGTIAALLDLGAGFHPDYTGRENIYLFGSFRGLGRKQVSAHYEEIIDFAEIGEFIDQPIKHYSSGMYLRLAFASAIMLDPDILIIDEALGVGDQRFQQKCTTRLQALRETGKTIIVVSHNMPLVRKLSTQAIWLEHGHCRASGKAGPVVDAYLASQEDRVHSMPEQLDRVGQLWTGSGST